MYEDELADNGAAVLSVKIVRLGSLLPMILCCGCGASCIMTPPFLTACDGYRIVCSHAFLSACGWGTSKAERHSHLSPGILAPRVSWYILQVIAVSL